MAEKNIAARLALDQHITTLQIGTSAGTHHLGYRKITSPEKITESQDTTQMATGKTINAGRRAKPHIA